MTKGGGTYETDGQVLEELRQHYEREKTLARKLRNSTPEERKHLYREAYNELTPLTPEARQCMRPLSAKEYASLQMKILKPFLKRARRFLEIGPGDCSLSFEVAKHVREVVAIDVKDQTATTPPSNFRLIISDGINLNVDHASVDIAYSSSVMEHIHPEDAEIQLSGIYAALVPGGTYICITPHRYTGPHDISGFFDEVATGLHLKEYTYDELRRLFSRVGFSCTAGLVVYGPLCLSVPVHLFILLEKILFRMPRRILRSQIPRFLLGIRVAASK